MVSSSLKLPFSKGSRCQIYKKKENKVTFLKSNLNSILTKNSNESAI